MKQWVWTVANERVHGTTHETPSVRWTSERAALQPIGNRPPYPFAEDEPRRVARDAYVAGRVAAIRCRGSLRVRRFGFANTLGRVEIFHGADRIAQHDRAGRHRVVTQAEHHRGIPARQPEPAAIRSSCIFGRPRPWWKRDPSLRMRPQLLEIRYDPHRAHSERPAIARPEGR